MIDIDLIKIHIEAYKNTFYTESEITKIKKDLQHFVQKDLLTPEEKSLYFCWLQKAFVLLATFIFLKTQGVLDLAKTLRLEYCTAI